MPGQGLCLQKPHVLDTEAHTKVPKRLGEVLAIWSKDFQWASVSVTQAASDMGFISGVGLTEAD